MNKVALIVYHKNADKIYPAEWIEKFRDSILWQTFTEFDIFEVDYGETGFQIFEFAKSYESIKLANFAFAMNHLIDKCFARGYHCVANTNVDDYYSLRRLEYQLPAIEKGYDVVSSNFSLVDKIGHIVLTHQFHGLDIKAELDRDHNIVCHPSVIISRKFWEKHRYRPNELPLEDMLLWQRGLADGKKFFIHPDVLCYHRLHEKSVGHNLKEA